MYLNGRYSWNKRTAADLETAISYFNQAIAKDPGYALAYAGLADAYSTLPSWGGGSPSENYSRSNAAARMALELDGTMARPHAVLGDNDKEYDFDFAGGEAEFKKALEFDPNDGTVHQWYAEKIGMIGGREKEALAEANRARQLDPLSPIISWEVGNVHNLARQYDEAIVACKKVANENPTFAATHLCLADAYWGNACTRRLLKNGKPMASFLVTDAILILLLPRNKDFVQRAGRVLSLKASKLDKRNARRGTRLRTPSPLFMLTWETKSRLSGGSTPGIRSAIGC